MENSSFNSYSTILNHSIIGNGRSYILLVEKGSRFELIAQAIASLLADIGQILLIVVREIGQDWRAASNELLSFIDSNNIRSVSFVAFGDSAVVAQALALRRPRLLRTMTFIDGATRAHPSSFVRLVEKIEGYLPLGLPFRSDFPGFDGKPFLQRIRCPVLVVLSPYADQYRKAQARLFQYGMPTSFLIEIGEDEVEQQIARAIVDFQNIPVKMPQKNIR